jgi:hypothetical protein
MKLCLVELLHGKISLDFAFNLVNISVQINTIHVSLQPGECLTVDFT